MSVFGISPGRSVIAKNKLRQDRRGTCEQSVRHAVEHLERQTGHSQAKRATPTIPRIKDVQTIVGRSRFPRRPNAQSDLGLRCWCGIFDVGTPSLFPSSGGGTAWIEYDFMNQYINWHATGPSSGVNKPNPESRRGAI